MYLKKYLRVKRELLPRRKTVEQLLKLGFTVAVESGAGALASFDDAAFEVAGASVVNTEEV